MIEDSPRVSSWPDFAWVRPTKSLPGRPKTRTRRSGRHHEDSSLADRGLPPLPLLRYGIRRLCAQRLRDEQASSTSSTAAWLREIERGRVAEVPEKANEQHYEVLPALFEMSLGPNLKYSSCFFPAGDEDLATGRPGCSR